jgi:membrane protein YdbS with pleckstrin-like domain
MRERVAELLLRLLRVPPEPQVPVEARNVRVFRAAPAYFRYKLATWGLTQLGALIGLIAATALSSPGENGGSVVVTLYRLGEIAAWVFFVGQAVFSLAVLRLDFDMRWYILSDRSLRIREGILTVREKTMTYANIQNISIRQNPIQRLFGIYDVEVRSAGGGAGESQGGSLSMVSMGDMNQSHVAHFRGIDNPEEIRTAIRERIRLHRDSGLGDPDEPAPAAAPVEVPGDGGEHAALDAARELRNEMRLFRRALEDSLARR